MSDKTTAWDHYAAAALTGLLANGRYPTDDMQHAAEIADEMMVLRQFRNPKEAPNGGVDSTTGCVR
jgi:hypothetical protein